MLYIDPAECIDCEACVPRCPVEAIYLDEDVAEQWQHYVALNAEMAPKCPPITAKKENVPIGSPARSTRMNPNLRPGQCSNDSVVNSKWSPTDCAKFVGYGKQGTTAILHAPS